MKKPIWLNHNLLPTKHSKIKRCGPSKSFFWKNESPVLVAIDEYKRLVPPIYDPVRQKRVINDLKIKHYTLSGLAVAPAVVTLTASCYSHFTAKGTGIILSFSLLALIYFLTFKLGFSSVKGIKQRFFFSNWIVKSKQLRFFFWTCFFYLCSLFLFQISSQYILGSLDAVFQALGMMYEDIANFEFWRLFTGTQLHYSFLHFMSNAMMFLICAPLCLSLIGKRSIVVFFVGNIAGAYFQYLIGGDAFDNCGGISFGNFSLIGFILGYSVANKNLLPLGMNYTILASIALAVISSEFINERAASTGHIVGVMVGFAMAFLLSYKTVAYFYIRRIFRI